MADEVDAHSGEAGLETAGQTRRKKRDASATPVRVPRDPSANGIQMYRATPRKSRETSAAPARESSTLAASASPEARSGVPRSGSAADADPWTVPQSVRDRFVQDGHRFYFPDGNPAFRDLGRRLTTPSENTQVIHSLIEIAHSRDWTEVTVTGTGRFRHEAWKQARMAGLSVRGFRPDEEQRMQLVRALGRKLPQSPQRVDSISADAPPVSAPEVGAPGTGPDGVRERIVGRLVDHGKDAYRHDPNEDPSYFVRLQTREGTREIWGKDIERAVAKSLTQPQRGEEVVLQRTGRDTVTVQRQETDAEGNPKSKAIEVFRNRWVIEKREFFEQRAAAAEIVRNERIGPREAVRQHPELAGTYLNLHAAELAARGLRDSEDQRRFVARVRRALADDIEQGEPLQPVRLRNRTTPRRTKDHEPLGRQ